MTRTVIPSAARNLTKPSWGCRMRFFTPLRYVQNDMTESCAPFRTTWPGMRYVQNDMAGVALRSE